MSKHEPVHNHPSHFLLKLIDHLHLDAPLLGAALLVLMVGLFILYSASNQSKEVLDYYFSHLSSQEQTHEQA